MIGMFVYFFVVVLVAALYIFFIFPTQWLKVERNRYPLGLGIRVLQISDVHVERLRVSPKRIRRLIEAEKPDYVFLTGDYTMKSRHLPKVRRFMQEISLSGVPAYAVLGNHDHRLKPAALQELIQILEKVGIQVLNNRSVDAGRFQIVGVDDSGSKKSNIDKAFNGTDSGKTTLVLTHNPNLVLSLKRKYALLMAGHFHGMQVNIPFLFRLMRRGKLVEAGIYKGLHHGEYGAFYISKGIGQAGVNARFFVRSEVTIHEL
jgi:predicted MPP superfamily phosphohydrolase